MPAECGKLLDMAPHAVDDLYTGCREQALKKFINPSTLGKELNRSKGFQKAWDTQVYQKLIPGKMKEHYSALNAYFHGDEQFIDTFNHEVETLGETYSTYEKEFHFKSFHFLLVDSMTANQAHVMKNSMF
uniref:NAD(P)(+)--arginine ADP-ribosyltransferase n=1 Tax=Mola mola TaxID=94237 RepID=A0A3Q4AVN7_MOLML